MASIFRHFLNVVTLAKVRGSNTVQETSVNINSNDISALTKLDVPEKKSEVDCKKNVIFEQLWNSRSSESALVGCLNALSDLTHNEFKQFIPALFFQLGNNSLSLNIKMQIAKLLTYKTAEDGLLTAVTQEIINAAKLTKFLDDYPFNHGHEITERARAYKNYAATNPHCSFTTKRIDFKLSDPNLLHSFPKKSLTSSEIGVRIGVLLYEKDTNFKTIVIQQLFQQDWSPRINDEYKIPLAATCAYVLSRSGDPELRSQLILRAGMFGIEKDIVRPLLEYYTTDHFDARIRISAQSRLACLYSEQEEYLNNLFELLDDSFTYRAWTPKVRPEIEKSTTDASQKFAQNIANYFLDIEDPTINVDKFRPSKVSIDNISPHNHRTAVMPSIAAISGVHEALRNGRLISHAFQQMRELSLDGYKITANFLIGKINHSEWTLYQRMCALQELADLPYHQEQTIHALGYFARSAQNKDLQRKIIWAISHIAIEHLDLREIALKDLNKLNTLDSTKSHWSFIQDRIARIQQFESLKSNPLKLPLSDSIEERVLDNVRCLSLSFG